MVSKHKTEETFEEYWEYITIKFEQVDQKGIVFEEWIMELEISESEEDFEEEKHDEKVEEKFEEYKEKNHLTSEYTYEEYYEEVITVYQ